MIRHRISCFVFVLALLGVCLMRPAHAIVLIKKGVSAPILFALYDSTAGQTAITGQTGAAVGTPVNLVAGVGGNITVNIHQAGVSGTSAATGQVEEIGVGLYYYITATADTSSATVGDNIVAINVTCSGCQGYAASAQSVGFDPNDAAALGLSNVSTAATQATAAATSAANTYTRLGAPSGASIDADILTRLATSAYTSPTGAVVTVSPTDVNIAAAVWNALAASYATTGTFGAALGNAGSINLTSGLVNLNFAQTLPTDVLPLTTLSIDNVGNALWCAITVGAGKQTISGTGFISYDLTGALTIRNFLLSPAAGTPSSRQ